MSGAVATTAPTPRRRPHFRRLLIGAVTILAIAGIAKLLGWDISAWFQELWDTMTEVSIQYLIAGVVLQTFQTLFTALAWVAILRYAYPQSKVTRLQMIACYAASVALNTFLPANLGTLMLLFMYAAIIAGATFAGVFAGYLVEKIFFTVIGAVVYLYLFLSVGGSFEIKFERVHENPWLWTAIILGGIFLIVILCRILWGKLKKLWAQAKVGGAILGDRRAYFGRVFLPEFLGWCCKLGVIAVFLAAYGIPVSFHVVMQVVGGNSIANVASVTPGGVGVNQAFNVASLRDVTDATTATAYSVAQQLITTAWNILFAIVLLIWAFGWSGGKLLVEQSYGSAKEKAAEQSAARKAKKEAKRAAEAEEGG
jgi:uncharacterized membrane protein YbhN (UPF0104 family)